MDRPPALESDPLRWQAAIALVFMALAVPGSLGRAVATWLS